MDDARSQKAMIAIVLLVAVLALSHASSDKVTGNAPRVNINLQQYEQPPQEKVPGTVPFSEQLWGAYTFHCKLYNNNPECNLAKQDIQRYNCPKQ